MIVKYTTSLEGCMLNTAVITAPSTSTNLTAVRMAYTSLSFSPPPRTRANAADIAKSIAKYTPGRNTRA